MPSGTLTPTPYQTVLDANGNPVSGAKIYTYVAGTSTPATTYTDVGLTVANANPIIANSAGRYVAYLSPGSSYKYIIQDSSGAAITTQDNISTVPPASINLDVTGVAGEAFTAGQAVYLSDGTGGKVAGSWYKADVAQAYSSILPEVGIVPAAIASGSSGTIRLAGSVTGLSSLVVGSPYYVGTGGALSATASTNHRLLGFADTTSSLVLTPIPTSWYVTTITTTGSATGAWVVLAGNTEIRCNNATLLSIAGIPAGYDGQQVRLVSIGAGQIDLLHQSGTEGTAAARLINLATVGNTSLAAGSGICEYQYDATTARWRLISHEQGAWITPTYAAGDYTATGGGTWTVDAGDVVISRYRLSGRTLQWILQIDATSISGTVNQANVKVPGGFTVTVNTAMVGLIYDNSVSVGVAGLFRCLGAGTLLNVIFLNTATNFTPSANLTYLRVELIVEVQ